MVALATTVAVIVMEGVPCVALLGLAAVATPAVVARELRAVVRTSLLLALPVGLSAALVNILFAPGVGTALLELGPFRVTEAGLGLAALVVARVFVIAGAGTLFYRTTSAPELVADLERRSLPPRMTFVVASAVTTIPTLAQRASVVAQAQRARGLDTGGGVLGRARGLLPLVAPTILGAIADVEERTLALESRGFTRPGRRTLLWTPPDSGGQRVVRWAMVVAVAALVVARVAGVGSPC